MPFKHDEQEPIAADSAVDALIKQRLKDYVLMRANDAGIEHFFLNVCQSPIEERLLAELLFSDQWGYACWEHISLYDAQNGLDPSEEHAFNHALVGKSILCLAPQYPAGPYAIDIAVMAKIDGKVLRIAVECDGHDYHERTKQQAQHDKKRDRVLQQLGWYVFRFTGSEIFKDAVKCADEVADYVQRWISAQIKERRS